jgi:hypothetical protein
MYEVMSISSLNFEKVFVNILDLSSKDNTYKFALARFLLDYSKSSDNLHASFETIADYFLKYYWNIQCKYRLKQDSHLNRQPVIISILERHFPKSGYPEYFDEVFSDPKYAEQIKKCTRDIIDNCFNDVISRFQRLKFGNKIIERKIFFEYKVGGTSTNDRVYPDLKYGIDIIPEARDFLSKNYVFLTKSVILEWSRFLEKLNKGVPKIIEKTEGSIVQRNSLTKFRKQLEPFFKNCFYCHNPLKSGAETHVDHVIPFDYIAEDEMWNFVLACNKCNCSKLGSLPPVEYMHDLISRNKEYRTKIPMLNQSLILLGVKERDENKELWEKEIWDYYERAKSHGYMVLDKIPI